MPQTMSMGRSTKVNNKKKRADNRNFLKLLKNEGGSEFGLFLMNGSSKIFAIETLNSKSVKMELDTGAAI